MLIYLYIQSISVLTKYCSSQIIQNWISQGQIILWIRLGSVWSRWVLVRNEQTTIPGPSLVEIDSSLIEQVHCGSSSILLATFFETPSIYSSWWVPWHYVCNKHLTTSPGKDKDKEEDNYKYEYKRYHKYHEIMYLTNTWRHLQAWQGTSLSAITELWTLCCQQTRLKRIF